MPSASRPPLSRPVDFEPFWMRTRQQLAAVDPEPEHETLETKGELVLERLRFSSLGDARLQGYLLRWDDDVVRPLVVHGHGYGSAVSPSWRWARRGLHVAGVDVRGFGGSSAAVPAPSRWGWVLTGIESPASHVLRGAVCDVLQAARVARDRLGPTTAGTVLHGMSFAGALALMAQAVDPLADLLVLAYPSLGWAEGRRFLARGGSAAEINRYLERLPEHAAEDVMVVLRYFDPMNFAPWVRRPVLIGLGEVDDVVPAHTVLAIAAWLGGPHEIMRFPVSHSDSPEMQRWETFERRWLELARHASRDGQFRLRR